MSRKKILFLAANPMSSTPLALDEELRDIEDKIRAAEHRDSLDLKIKLAIRPEDLQQALLEEQPTIVHFSGHGSGKPGLVLHGETDGAEKLVTADALGDLFRVLKDNIRIVVLNACYAAHQAEAIAREIDFVVGMKDRIGDRAARAFAASFYRGLGFGRSVQTAFDLGLNAIKLEGHVKDADVPILMVREGVDAEAVKLVVEGPAVRDQDPRGDPAAPAGDTTAADDTTASPSEPPDTADSSSNTSDSVAPNRHGETNPPNAGPDRRFFIVGCVMSGIVGILLIWAFGSDSLAAHQISILNVLIPLASAFLAGSFVGAFTVKAKGWIPGIVATATSGFGVFLLLYISPPWIPPEAFTVTVCPHGPKSSLDEVKPGEVRLQLGDTLRTRELGSKGQAVFSGIPSALKGKSVPVRVIAPGYKMARGSMKVRLDPGKTILVPMEKVQGGLPKDKGTPDGKMNTKVKDRSVDKKKKKVPKNKKCFFNSDLTRKVAKCADYRELYDNCPGNWGSRCETCFQCI